MTPNFIIVSFLANFLYFSVNFSCHFLLEIASILECESVTFELAADVSRPGLIHPSEEDEHSKVLMLLMPMKREQ